MTTEITPQTYCVKSELTREQVEAAIRVLREGGLVALATEWQAALSAVNGK